MNKDCPIDRAKRNILAIQNYWKANKSHLGINISRSIANSNHLLDMLPGQLKHHSINNIHVYNSSVGIELVILLSKYIKINIILNDFKNKIYVDLSDYNSNNKVLFTSETDNIEQAVSECSKVLKFSNFL